MEIKYKDIPENWQDRCSGDGHKTYLDKNNNRRFEDNDELITEDTRFRPCAKCGEYPSLDGDDACISNLGNVMNACCGHGTNRGYIQFDSGIIIEGDFEITRFEPYDMDYAIRPREEIFNKIKELETDNQSNKNQELIELIKWIMQIKD